MAPGSSCNSSVENSTTAAAAYIPKSPNYYPTLGDARAALLSMQSNKSSQESSSLWTTSSDRLNWSPKDIGKGDARQLNPELDGSAAIWAHHTPAFRSEVSLPAILVLQISPAIPVLQIL
jgi:hypothetical protein